MTLANFNFSRACMTPDGQSCWSYQDVEPKTVTLRHSLRKKAEYGAQDAQRYFHAQDSARAEINRRPYNPVQESFLPYGFLQGNEVVMNAIWNRTMPKELYRGLHGWIRWNSRRDYLPQRNLFGLYEAAEKCGTSRSSDTPRPAWLWEHERLFQK